MKLTADKVSMMIATAEKNGFTKESVYKAIKANRATHRRADAEAKEYWEK